MRGFFAGSAVTALVVWVLSAPPSRWLLVLAPAVSFLCYRLYRTYISRIDQGQQQARDMADLHLATIEALAQAIDAKDQTSQSHLRRVQLYATSVASAMGMSGPEVQGVKTAALLHDIGKLAVPEHILSKPGPLTPEEFQKIRAHPEVGADIVSTIPFPYPVAPLIRSHHERWDGKGYPSGLRGEEIPLGARILSAVDYLDALRADRPHHRAMSTGSAVAVLRQESGQALDPAVVTTLLDLLPSLDRQAAAIERQSTTSGVSAEPAESRPAVPAGRNNVYDDIALAHREIYALYEIAQAMGTSLGVADTMALITAKLNNLVPYSCAALFLLEADSDTLRCQFATGTDADLVQQVTLRTGEGLTGWDARNRRPLVNARPSADFEAARLTDRSSSLQSALVCPLLFNDRFIGTLSVYHQQASFFTDDHRRLLDRVSEQAAAVINNSILFEQTQEDSRTDALTGLPNTRFLVMHLSGELARARRLGTEVALMLMDVDGFKEINDTHGHHVGDRALCDIARVLHDAIRPYDVCVRYAGDEFIVVLPGCSAAEAAQKRVELQQAVDDMLFEVRPGRRVELGISVGVAVFSRDGDSYETLLATADSRMYQDKAARKRRSLEDTTAALNGDA
jgi:diguanylate cyclase (GGDEF)-like protein/putative nucleotidyltransferase with HDIG domain